MNIIEMGYKNGIDIIVQGYYGNRNSMVVTLEDFDELMLGYPLSAMREIMKVDRTIVKVPNTDNMVIIYNKYMEESQRKNNEIVFEEDGDIAKPLAFIPEENIEIYSRCIVCRMNESGELESLNIDEFTEADFENLGKYLAE